MTVARQAISAARAALDQADQRADHRQVGQLVRYPRLEGDRLVDAFGTITNITCVTPALPYQDRILVFEIACLTGRRPTDVLRVSVGYRGIVQGG